MRIGESWDRKFRYFNTSGLRYDAVAINQITFESKKDKLLTDDSGIRVRYLHENGKWFYADGHLAYVFVWQPFAGINVTLVRGEWYEPAGRHVCGLPMFGVANARSYLSRHPFGFANNVVPVRVAYLPGTAAGTFVAIDFD